MNNIEISPNIKSIRERIDTNGNVINPRTRQIITPNIEERVSPEDMIPKAKINTPTETPATTSMQDKINQMVEAKIKERIDAIVAQRVEEALSKL